MDGWNSRYPDASHLPLPQPLCRQSRSGAKLSPFPLPGGRAGKWDLGRRRESPLLHLRDGGRAGPGHPGLLRPRPPSPASSTTGSGFLLRPLPVGRGLPQPGARPLSATDPRVALGELLNTLSFHFCSVREDGDTSLCIESPFRRQRSWHTVMINNSC